MVRDESLYAQLATLLLLAADRANPLAWQKLLNLSGLSAGVTGTKKVLTLTFFIATSGQLTTVVLPFTA